jgi:hypothetical protein
MVYFLPGARVNGGSMGLLHRMAQLLTSKEEAVPSERPGRNDACWCGSGKKYKKCHLPEDEKKTAKNCSQNCGQA